MAQIKKVTMKDIAQELDISIVTVSNALAGKDGVGDRLREVIIDKAKELGYIFKKNEDIENVNRNNVWIFWWNSLNWTLTIIKRYRRRQITKESAGFYDL